MSTGKRIKELRGPTTQAEFADILGIHKNTLGNYERGQRTPDVEFLALVSKKLGVSTHWLVFGEGPVFLTPSEQPAETVEVQTEQQPALPASGGELNYLRNECRELREENRELRQENRELRQENTRLVNENADLRIALEKLKPDRDEYGDTGGLRQSA